MLFFVCLERTLRLLRHLSAYGVVYCDPVFFQVYVRVKNIRHTPHRNSRNMRR